MIKRKKAEYRQGSFSNLCGPYSIMNAFHELLGAEFGEELRKKTFKDMLRHIEAEFGTYETLKNGTTVKEMDALCKVARRRINAGKPAFRIGKLQKLPHDRNDDLEAIFGKLEEILCPDCVAIVGLEGSEDHWAVATDVKQQGTKWELQLLDSDSGTRRKPESVQIGTKRALKDASNQKRSDRPLFIMPKQIILLRVVR